MAVASSIPFTVSGVTGKYVGFNFFYHLQAYSAVTGARCQLLNAVPAPGTPTVAKDSNGGVTGSLSTGVYHYAAQFVTANGVGVVTPSTNTGPNPMMPDQTAVFGSGTIGSVITLVTGDMLNVKVTVQLPMTTGTGYHGLGSAAPAVDPITGINIFRTKKDTPGATGTPTASQWWLVASSPMVTGPFSGGVVTYIDTIADSSLVSTHAPLVDLTGFVVEDTGLITIGTGNYGGGQPRFSPIANNNKGGFWVNEVTGALSGQVEGAYYS